MKIEQTFGYGIDFVLSLDNNKMILLEEPNKEKYLFQHGVVEKGQIDLTLKEAEKLYNELGFQIQQYKNINETFNNWCEEEDKKYNYEKNINR